jgi:hypothetical protein
MLCISYMFIIPIKFDPYFFPVSRTFPAAWRFAYINAGGGRGAMPLIHAYFYSPSETDHFINHIVTTWDPPYAHCDVQFQDGMASSVYQGETIYWRKRRFTKPGYNRVTLSVGQAEYDRAYQLCRDRFASSLAFDALGMYTLPLSSVFGARRAGYTFCSKHCTEVLQAAGVRSVADLDPRAMTPSALRRALHGSSVLHTDRIDLRIQAPTAAAAAARRD